ncbi:MAG: 16S rRNA (uracil(1498)-N(3))-methyltransferase [Methylophaga sp.]|nr:MAG: 16S rRNA (uracil(1498)-N(3))-methyltransferase [Methylophaga sp.]
MRIPRLYCPELSENSETMPLPEKVHRHAVQVLRLKQGAELHLFDGQGLKYSVVLEEVTKRNSTAKLMNKLKVENESSLSITLLQGVSRGERMDYALQKAVELGVNHIIPVITQRCNVNFSGDRANKKQLHWQGVITSACEQSGRSILPILSNVTQLEEVITNCTVECRLVLDPLADSGLTALAKQKEVALLIGPEGGLAEQEVQQAVDMGFQAVTMGSRILRTETATVAALAVVQAIWGDIG